MTNVKFLNPFVDAVVDVLKAECGVEARRGQLSLQKLALTTDDLTVLISLVGQVQGVVLYGLSTQTGLDLVSRVMEQPFHELDSLAQSGVGPRSRLSTSPASSCPSKPSWAPW